MSETPSLAERAERIEHEIRAYAESQAGAYLRNFVLLPAADMIAALAASIKGATMDDITNGALIANVRGNVTFEPDADEGGMATLAIVDADLLELVLQRLASPPPEARGSLEKIASQAVSGPTGGEKLGSDSGSGTGVRGSPQERPGKWVPMEPTEEMLSAAMTQGWPWKQINRLIKSYRLMIAVAPSIATEATGVDPSTALSDPKSSPSPRPGLDREAWAAIIDPQAAEFDNPVWGDAPWKVALAKADQIIALTQSAREGE